MRAARQLRRHGLLLVPLSAALVLAGAPGASGRTSTAPLISSFSPAAAPVAASVAITGSGFTGATAVAFAGTAASFSVVDDGDIATSVPSGALTGKLTVTTPEGTATSATAFKVRPTVSGLSPRWGLPGTVVTITGSAFTGATAVTFNGVATTTFTVDSYTQITAVVPAAATTGRVRVKTNGGWTKSGSSTSMANFDVLVGGPGWLQYGHDGAHSGYNPDETILDPGNVSALRIGWSAPLFPDLGVGYSSSPAVADGIVYVGSGDSRLHAFDAATGASLWSGSTGTRIRPSGSSPAVVDGIVYVGSYDHKLYAFDTASGALLWTAATGDVIASSPAVANGIVYVGSYDQKLYAFDASNGALLWSATTGGGIVSSPAVANGVVYVGSEDHTLYAFDAGSGAARWSATTGSNVEASPAVASGVVYITSWDHKLYAYDAAGGALLWRRTIAGFVGRSSPAVANGVVYVTSVGHSNLHAFDAASGVLLWSTPTLGPVGSSPAVANGVVYLGASKSLSAYDATSGALLWAASSGCLPAGASAAVANGVVYVGASSYRRVCAYQLPPALMPTSR